MWKRLLAMGSFLCWMSGCAVTPVAKVEPTEKPFFDRAVVDAFVPGKATQQEIRKALGEPYPDPLKTPQRWTYMYTSQKQVILLFRDEVLTEKRWSEEYGIGTGTR